MPRALRPWRTRLSITSADVLHVQTRAVEGAIRRHRAQHLADRPDAAFARRFRALHHHRRGAHPHDHAVTAAVERNRGVFHHLIGGRRPARQETRAEPVDQVIGRDVVRRDDDHPAAPAGADPVLRH